MPDRSEFLVRLSQLLGKRSVAQGEEDSLPTEQQGSQTADGRHHATLDVELTELFRRQMESGETISLSPLLELYPAAAERLELAFHAALEKASPNLPVTGGWSGEPGVEVTADSNSGPATPQPTPEHLGRHRIVRVLGSGGFGVVYEGFDEQLQRQVAVKVARRPISSESEAQEQLAEARFLAQLDHPGIVPVYDVGRTESGALFIVSKFVAGTDLATFTRNSELSHREVARIVAEVASALAYAHGRGVVHRDIKPGNILLTEDRKPVVVDFGLAMHDADFGKGARFVGTPAYMSPEQARQEGHLVDGRSDVYSLGAIFYELLVGKRPFNAHNLQSLLDLIRNVDVRPPRQIDRSIPRELERICLRSLSKLVADRYNTAGDMAEDLERWDATLAAPSAPLPEPENESTSSNTPRSSKGQGITIVPRGLRSFEASDSDFYLHLLPGARDRDGLPESVRFWKAGIENTDPDQTFRIGVLLGPSGSGKSSLIRAGLLPNLGEQVVPVVVSSDARDLPKQILRRIGKQFPAYKQEASLHDALVAIRRRQGLPQGRTLLIVLDQFEQWLNYHSTEVTSDLSEALRQCDGIQIKALLLVRDDFTFAMTQFMDQIEEPLSQNRNFATAERFSRSHAKDVLVAFGRAFGALDNELPPEQQRFLDAAVDGLSQDGRLVPIQLALFAEMVKDKAWTMATFREYGGTEGFGVAFLEEKLAGSSANPILQANLETTRQILAALLPEEGAVIKGRARTRAELLAAVSEFARPDTFDRVLNLLDTELRLITPSAFDPTSSSDSVSSVREPAFQLTHDYLVPTIRRWLTSHERASRRGRVRVQLRELAQSWAVRPERRRLPTLLEWTTIRALIRPANWTPDERRMMRAADHRVLFGLMIGLAVVFAGTVLWIRFNGQSEAKNLLTQLLNADTSELPEIVADVERYQRWAIPLLADELAEQQSLEPDPADTRQQRRRLHLGLALLGHDQGQLDCLVQHLDRVPPADLPVVAELLEPHAAAAARSLETHLLLPDGSVSLATASVLAALSPDSPQWKATLGALATRLTSLRPTRLFDWVDHFAPLGDDLVPLLLVEFKDSAEPGTDRWRNLQELLVQYAFDEPEVMTMVVEDSEVRDVKLLAEVMQQDRAAASRSLRNRIETLKQNQPAGKSVPPELADRFGANEGVITPTFAMHYSIVESELPEWLEACRKASFHPVVLRPHRRDEECHYAIVWERHNLDSVLEIRLDASSLLATHQNQRDEGRTLVDLAPVPGTEPIRFAAVWRVDPDQSQVRFYVDRSFAEHEEASAALRKDGFELLRYAVYQHGPTTRHAAVWKQDDRRDEPYSMSRVRYAKFYGDLYPSYLQTDSQIWSLTGHRSSIDADATVLRRQGTKTATGLATLAYYRRQRGELTEALKILDQMLTRQPTSKTALRIRATTNALLGNREALASDLETYTEVGGAALSQQLLKLRLATLESNESELSRILAELEKELEDSTTGSATTMDVVTALAIALKSSHEDSRKHAATRRSRIVDLLRKATGKLTRRDLVTLAESPDFDHLRERSEFRTLNSELRVNRLVSGAWTDDVSRISKTLIAQPFAKHSRESRQLAGAGFHPVALSVNQDVDTRAIQCSSVWHKTLQPIELRVRRIRRLANLCLTLSELGDSHELLAALAGQVDESLRNNLIAETQASGVPASWVVQQLEETRSERLRSSLLLILGAYPANQIPEADLEQVKSQLPRWLQSDSPHLRSAALWCSRQLGVRSDEAGQGPGWQPGRKWYTNVLGQTMIVLSPPARTLNGSPRSEPGRGSSEQQQWISIPRSFGLGATEVTVADFHQFLEDPQVAQKVRFSYTESFAPTAHHPQISVNWYRAAQFCQWLSETEGLPEEEWCYPGILVDEPSARFRLPADYLRRGGYRLPTEAEWEYACRGGVWELRSCGIDSRILPAFAWFTANSGDTPHPVTSLRPNAYGFFDLLGNVNEWCHNEFKPYQLPADSDLVVDVESDQTAVAATTYRISRGGSFRENSANIRAANRYRSVPTSNSISLGFRVARTLNAAP